MRHFQVSSFALFSLPAFTYAASLIDTLKANGAGRFAGTIEANSTLLAIYTAPGIKTVFGVPDTSYTGIARRQSANAQQLELHCSLQLTSLETLTIFPGAVSSTRLIVSTLNGQPQSVVSQSGLVLTTPSKKNRRQVSGVTISSGLGNKVNFLKGNIAYDGGVIHLVDGLFTLPQSVSSTISSTGLGSLEAILRQADALDLLTSSNVITFFAPSAAALTPYLSITNKTALKTIILNHVVPNFVGYLPLLKDGVSYPTLGGQPLTITVKQNAFFANGAQIVSPNTITANGVVHGIDKVLAPPPPPGPSGSTVPGSSATKTGSSATSKGASGSGASATSSATATAQGSLLVRPQGGLAMAIGIVVTLVFALFIRKSV